MTGEPVLTAADLGDDPISAFSGWLAMAGGEEGPSYPNACCLSTVGSDGGPRGRIVLLKGVDERGFVFFTNYRSAKARGIEADPRAALTFYWDHLARQVRVVGDVEKVSVDESDAYFATRPRGSQIGAWASNQSEPLDSRDTLEARYREFEARAEGLEMARPAHWGGFRVLPRSIEFWQGRADRLHDRILFERDDPADMRSVWRAVRLNP